MEKNASKDNVFIKILKYLIPWKGDKVTEIIRKIIFLSAVIVLITTVVIFVSAKLESRQNIEDNNSLANLFHNTGTGVQIDTSQKEEIQQQNPGMLENFLPFFTDEGVTNNRGHKVEANDIRGWLTINGYGDEKPLVDNIVMQFVDNDYYLTHNSYGEAVRSGSLYIDYRCDVSDGKNPGNIVVYGHNMLDAPGEIDYFGVLLQYFNYAKKNYGSDGRLHQSDIEDPNSAIHDISFYKQHPTLNYSTLYENSTYKIFGGMMANTNSYAGEVFNYHRVHSFKNKDEFDGFCAEILDRSCFINPDVDLKYGDELITLSTCIYGYGQTANTRFVIFARKTRDGESPEVDVEKAYANPSPKFYDTFDQMFDYKWEGRKWPTDIIWGFGEE